MISLKKILTKILTELETKLSKTGGHMYGDLLHTDASSYYSSDNVERAVASPTNVANPGNSRIEFTDSNSSIIGVIRYYVDNLRYGMQLATYYSDYNYNSLILGFDSSGNRVVRVTEKDPWCAGIGAVKLSGDTMTGNLSISKSAPQLDVISSNLDSAVGETIPASGESQFGGIIFHDKNNYNMGWFRQYKNYQDKTYTQMCIRRSVNGSDVTNHLTLGIDANGAYYVSVKVGAEDAWCSAIGAVKVSGDTMTGHLFHDDKYSYYDSSNMTRATVTQSSDTIYSNSRIQFRDKDDLTLGTVRYYANNARYGMQFAAFYDPNTSNALSLGFNSSGNPYVGVTNSAAWRTALGLAADSSWTTVSPVIAKKQGNVVTVSSTGNHSSAISANTYTDIATLPSGYRPSTTVYAAGILRSSYACIVRINTSGVVAVYSGNASAANGSFRFNLSFVI